MTMVESWACLAGAVVLLVFSVMAVVLNALLLTVLYKDPLKCFRSETTIYIISIAITDFFVGTAGGSTAAKSYVACALGNEDSGFIENHSMAFLIRNQNFLILAFSVERLGNTVFPVDNHRPGRIKSALICAGCIVLFSSCFSMFELLADKSWMHQLDVNFNMTIPFVATTAISTALYKSLKKPKNMPTTMDLTNGHFVPHEVSRNERKGGKATAIAFLFIALLFFISVLPYFALSLLEIYCIECSLKEWFVTGLRLSFAFTFLNSAANPLVYFICVPKFRRALKMVFNNQEKRHCKVHSMTQGKRAMKKITVTYI